MTVRETLCGIEAAEELLPEGARQALSAVSENDRRHIDELRLRRGRAFSAVLFGREYFVTPDGRLMNSPSEGVRVGSADIEYTFMTAFRGSVHAFPRELSEGFITCPSGNRAGFCGRAVIGEDGGVQSVGEVSSVNIRISRQVIGCAEPLYNKVFAEGLCSLIVASPPCGGKTTVLRDLCRLLGERYRVSLIDERCEIAAASGGVPMNDVGARTDVFSGYPKSEAVMTAVRVMSPEVIVCDEIGSEADLRALSCAADSGVRLICSCHAPDIDALKKRPAAGELIARGVFDRAAFLGTGAVCGKLTALYILSGTESGVCV